MRCLNPETHHGIIVNGDTFKKLIKKGYRYNNIENYLYKDEEVVYRHKRLVIRIFVNRNFEPINLKWSN